MWWATGCGCSHWINLMSLSKYSCVWPLHKSRSVLRLSETFSWLHLVCLVLSCLSILFENCLWLACFGFLWQLCQQYPLSGYRKMASVCFLNNLCNLVSLLYDWQAFCSRVWTVSSNSKTLSNCLLHRLKYCHPWRSPSLHHHPAVVSALCLSCPPNRFLKTYVIFVELCFKRFRV